MLRFALSPTKDMDINDLRVALFNYIQSKQSNEELLIRVDDTEKEKNIEGKDKDILQLLNLFGIEHSRVILQSENIKYHVSMGMKLLLDKKAFNCFCSDEALEQDKQKSKEEGKTYQYSGFCETISDETKFNCNAPFVVRIKKPEQTVKFSDLLKGEVTFEPDDIDYSVILKHDKTPTYNFACAVDDMIYNISTLIRSKNYLKETPTQITIMKALGYDKELKYAHIPDISTNNPLTVQSLIDEGYLPAAIANYLVLLGSNATKDIFSIEEAINWFDISKVSQEIIEFDINKLNSINKEYIKNLDEMRLSKILGYADSDIGSLAKIYLTESNTIKEIKSKIDTIFNEKDTLVGFEEELKEIKECLDNASFIKELNDLKSYITEKTTIDGEKLDTILKFALTGETKGPDLSEVYPLIRNYLGEIL